MFFRRQATEAFKLSMPLSSWLSSHVSEFDVVHVHGVFSHSSVAAGRACRKSGVPYVVRPLGQLDPWSVQRHAWRKKLLIAAAGRQLLDGAAAMHYTTAEEQRLASEAVGGLPPGVIVPLGIDDELFASAENLRSSRPPVLLAMSRLDEKKGIDAVITAFHRLAGVPELSDWRLLIAGVGSPSYVSLLRRMADGGAGRERIVFTGWIDGEARRSTLQAARLFVLASHQENFGIAVVEAMAAGLPAVVSPGVNLARDIADAGAGWVSERTPDALAASLNASMSNAAEVQSRAIAARRFADRFRWPAVGEALGSMYESLARTAPARRDDGVATTAARVDLE